MVTEHSLYVYFLHDNRPTTLQTLLMTKNFWSGDVDRKSVIKKISSVWWTIERAAMSMGCIAGEYTDSDVSRT
jgi:hypothetical protein